MHLVKKDMVQILDTGICPPPMLFLFFYFFNLLVSVLCKPEYPIYNADTLKAQQFRLLIKEKIIPESYENLIRH